MNLTETFATLQQRYSDYYGIDNVNKPFFIGGESSYTAGEFIPSKEVRLNRDASAFADWLRYINIEPRKQQQGGSLQIGPQGFNTSTSDTFNGAERKLNGVKNPVQNLYQMVKAHYDFGLHDDTLDEISEFPNWHQLYRQAFFEGLMNDRQAVGFHGIEHVTTSDKSTNTLGEDVNKGFKQLLRERNSSNIFTGDANGEVKIGEGGHYKTVDHFVQDLYQGIPLHKRKKGMTATMGAGLIGSAEGKYYADNGDTPSEKGLISKLITTTFGGLETVPAHYFPLNDIMITSLKRGGNTRANLSILWQKGKWRRSVEYIAKKETTADWNARREAYHIEDLSSIIWTDLQKVIFLDIKNSLGNPVEILSKPVDNRESIQ